MINEVNSFLLHENYLLLVYILLTKVIKIRLYLPQNKWPQLVSIPKLASVRHIGQVLSVLVRDLEPDVFCCWLFNVWASVSHSCGTLRDELKYHVDSFALIYKKQAIMNPLLKIGAHKWWYSSKILYCLREVLEKGTTFNFPLRLWSTGFNPFDFFRMAWTFPLVPLPFDSNPWVGSWVFARSACGFQSP